ncbi:MAG: SGNH/GDSL hydrolase family protein [Acidobacteriia bacterium]|nr:SGNH/GDSL hydrolase family protein [Terriglobia bacterium]
MKRSLVFLLGLILAQTAAAQQSADPCETLKRERQEMEAKLRDWPDLARYREDNAKLGAPASGESRVVFFGDSITEFWNLPASFPGKPYVNRGISGQTTPQMLLRFRQDVIALKPKVAVILAGTNDIAENAGPTTLAAIEGNLMSMAELARKNEIRVVLASVLPAARYPWRPEIRPVEKILALNAWMKEYAAQEGLVYLDYYAAMADEKQGLKAALTGDGVHPNDAGYAMMAPLAAEAIARASAKISPARGAAGGDSAAISLTRSAIS